MQKIDFKKTLKPLFSPPTTEFVEIDVPPMMFVKVDGSGDPNTAPAYKTAIEWLFSTSYAMKFSSKTLHGQDYVVPPLEGLWWADDPRAFLTRDKSAWNWTMMIMAPDFITQNMLDQAIDKTCKKLGPCPVSLRMEHYKEGLSYQILHIGSYDDEGPTLARLHDHIMPNARMTFNGPHHEIYLSDPRRTEAAKLKTILRQPVKKAQGIPAPE